LKEINIEYYLVSECEKNSIIDKAIHFYDEFVNNITEDSKVFQYLLNIDSGIGYYEGDPVYTFDMTNLETIKDHLKKLRPKFLLFFSYENDNIANTQKRFPCMAINRYNILDANTTKEIIFDKEVKENEDSANNTAIDLFILFFHESMGHQKFIYNKNAKNLSPKKIINESNDLIELERVCKYTEDDKEYILGSNCINHGDSGSYLELVYGKYGKDLIINLMLKLNDKGNLIKRIDLFTGQDCETLRKYIILKSEAKKSENEIKIEKKNNIDEEINELEKWINYKELITNNNNSYNKNNNKEFKLIGRKKKREKNNIDNEDSQSENIGKKKKYDEMNSEEKNDNFNSEKDDPNEEYESESDDYDDEECVDNDKLFKKLYKKILKKYKFKDDETVLRKISDKLKDDSITGDERTDLLFVLDYMDEVW